MKINTRLIAESMDSDFPKNLDKMWDEWISNIAEQLRRNFNLNTLSDNFSWERFTNDLNLELESGNYDVGE